jgi:hypothetical protein
MGVQHRRCRNKDPDGATTPNPIRVLQPSISPVHLYYGGTPPTHQLAHPDCWCLILHILPCLPQVRMLLPCLLVLLLMTASPLCSLIVPAHISRPHRHILHMCASNFHPASTKMEIRAILRCSDGQIWDLSSVRAYPKCDISYVQVGTVVGNGIA